MKVRLFKPCVGDEELAQIKEVFDISWLGMGGKVPEFENKWKAFIGAKAAMGVNSATAALQLAVGAFGFPKGKKVLVPAQTFVSTALAPLHNGLDVKFVDADEETLGMSVEDLERKYDDECVAVMPVHFGGHPVKMDAVVEFADAKGLKVIEDCAHTQGGEYQGKKLGTFGEVGCFSFEEKKGMTTGDGGMLVSDNEALVERLRPTRWLGIDKDTWKRSAGYTQTGEQDAYHWYYEIDHAGFKFNMNNLAAAIGLAQMEKLDWMNERKARAIGRYMEGLADVPEARPIIPFDLDGYSSYWIFGLRVPKRDELILHLKAKEIATSVHYTPLPMHPLFKNHTEPCPVAEKAYGEMVTLPLFPEISDEEIDYVVEHVRTFYGK